MSEEKLMTVSGEASGDLSSHQFKFMVIDSNNQLALNTSAGALCNGVLQDKPDAAGKAGSLGVGGVTKIVLGATLAAGAEVMSSAAGVAVAATATNKVLGTLRVGGASGEVGEMLWQPHGTA